MKLPDNDPSDFVEGEVLSDYDIEYAQLTIYENFGYVRHSVESWARCASWTTEHCGNPETPVHLRSLAFSRACPGCSGYDNCLSRYEHALNVSENPDMLNLVDNNYEYGLRALSYNALGMVLRTELSRYRALCDLSFEYSDFAPQLWFGTAIEELVPFVLPLTCTEHQRDIQCTWPFNNVYICDCDNTTFAYLHNPLRAIYRASAIEHNSNATDLNIMLYSMNQEGFFKCVTELFVSRSKQQEWLGTSTENPVERLDKVNLCNNTLLECFDDLMTNPDRVMQIERENGRPYDTADPPAEIIQRRFQFVSHIATLIYYDPGLPWETWHHVHYYLCSLMMPWRCKNVGVHKLDLFFESREDTSIIKGFIQIVDQLTDVSVFEINEAYERDYAFKDVIDKLTDEATSNFEKIHEKFWYYVSNHIIPTAEAREEVETCFVCMDPYLEQRRSIPRHLQPIRMPCCKKVGHLGCLQGSICRQPELHRIPRCPMCRADMRERGWFINADGITLSMDRHDYIEPATFFDFVHPILAPPGLPPVPLRPEEDEVGVNGANSGNRGNGDEVDASGDDAIDLEEDQDVSPMSMDSSSEASDGSSMDVDS